MMKKISACVAAVSMCAGVLASAVSVRADDTGLGQFLHSVRKEGRKVCMADHFHTGTSAGASSKKAAMYQAVDSWQGFTAAEYGTDWARYRKASSKSAKCSVGPSGWSCEVLGRPCK